MLGIPRHSCMWHGKLLRVRLKGHATRSLKEEKLAGDGRLRRQPDEPRGGEGGSRRSRRGETLIYPLPPHGKRGDESGLRDSNPGFRHSLKRTRLK